MRTLFAIPLLALVLAGCASPAYQTLDVHEWKHAYETTPDAFLLDVRTVAEYTDAHIPNATLIPHTEIAANAAYLPADKDAPIFVYCRSGSRSAVASSTLADMGYTNVVNMDGGIMAWAQAGYPLEAA